MFTKILSMAFIATLIAGCAKEKQYDEVEKTADLKFASAHQAKSTLLNMCTFDDPCLYVPSVNETPYEVKSSRPYWLGEQRLVVTSLDNQGKLQFLQIENDDRFQRNTNNLSPVLELDVEHVDYKCKEDDFGDCTNAEEVDADKSWDQRRYVKIKDINVVETNTLPIEFGEMFGKGCVTDLGKDITKLDVDNGAINMKVRKTYKGSFKCSGVTSYEQLMEQMRYLTFTVDYSYSIVKLSQLADKDYPVVEYPATDEGTFGFFTTNNKSRTVDNHDHLMGTRKTVMNRWSPNKNEVVFYLNSSFYDNDMKHILSSTQNAIETVNKSLEKANAKLRITLKKGEDSEIGDLRKNYLILVKDPQASGVIGYGPSVANPKTGEIVNARTVMYFGTIQKFVSRAYDELVDEVLAKLIREQSEAQAAQQTAENSGTSSAESDVNSKIQAAINAVNKKGIKMISTDTQYADFLARNFEQSFSQFENQRLVEQNLDFGNFGETKEEAYHRMFERLENGEKDDYEVMIDKLSRENFYHGDLVNYDEIVMREIEDEIKSGKLRYWDQLTEADRSKVMEKLLPYVWVPTLVHEFGHNLGLRHNFAGNTDPANFYSQEEAQSLGMRKQMGFSSIMDYAPKTNNELTVMGKYDIAALRFGYAREVEVVEDGNIKLQKVNKTLGQTEFIAPVKRYKFCTDGNVGTDNLCNRHDEGITPEDILDYYVSRYDRYYEKVSKRNRKYDFNALSGEYSYFRRILGLFSTIRTFFNDYDRAHRKGKYDGDEWKSNPELVSIKNASDKSFKFFKDILEQPAYHCIEFPKGGGKISRILPFSEMVKGLPMEKLGITFEFQNSCLFLNNEKYGNKDMAYAQFGKHLNNVLSFSYDRSKIKKGDITQMDVRGMWIDKIFAARYLGYKYTSPTAIGAIASSNYFHYPEYKSQLLGSLDALLENSITKEVDVMRSNGSIIKKKFNYEFFSSHKISKGFHYGINRFFGLFDAETNLNNVLLSKLKKRIRSSQAEGDIESEDALEQYYYFDVKKVSPRADLSLANFDKVVEFKDSKGKVKYRFGLYEYNTKGMELALMKDVLDKLKGEENAVKIITVATALKAKDIELDEVMDAGELNAKEILVTMELNSHDLEILQKVQKGIVQESLDDEVLLGSFLALSK